MGRNCFSDIIVVMVVFFFPLMVSANYYGEKDRFVETGVTKKHIIGITDKGEAFIYKKKSGKLVKQFEKKYFFINCGVSPGGDFAAVVYERKGEDAILADIIEIDGQKVTYRFQLANGKRDIDKIEVSNDGKILFVMSDYVNISNILYSTADGSVLWSEKQTTSYSNALSPDGSFIIATNYTMLRGGGIRGNYGLKVYNVDISKMYVSFVREVKLNKLKLAIRKRFGKIQPVITSHTFSERDSDLLFINYTFKKDKRYQDFVVKVDLKTGDVKSILDYGLTEKTSSHWNDSYKYENTLCELSDDVIVAGYEGKIYVGDFSSNKLVNKIERSIIMANGTLPDVACYSQDKTFAFTDTRSENKNKPAIYLMEYKNDEIIPLVSKVGGEQLEKAREEAKIAAEKRRKEEEAARIAAEKAKKIKLKHILKSLKQKKEVGDFVCLAGKKGFWFLEYDVMLKAYVERVSGKKIQLRITDSAQNANYNDVTLYRDSIIWDRYDSWYDCSLNN